MAVWRGGASRMRCCIIPTRAADFTGRQGDNKAATDLANEWAAKAWVELQIDYIAKLRIKRSLDNRCQRPSVTGPDTLQNVPTLWPHANAEVTKFNSMRSGNQVEHAVADKIGDARAEVISRPNTLISYQIRPSAVHPTQMHRDLRLFSQPIIYSCHRQTMRCEE